MGPPSSPQIRTASQGSLSSVGLAATGVRSYKQEAPEALTLSLQNLPPRTTQPILVASQLDAGRGSTVAPPRASPAHVTSVIAHGPSGLPSSIVRNTIESAPNLETMSLPLLSAPDVS